MNIVGLSEWKWSAVSVAVLVGGSIVGWVWAEVGGRVWREGAGCWSAVSPMSHTSPSCEKGVRWLALGIGQIPPRGRGLTPWLQGATWWRYSNRSATIGGNPAPGADLWPTHREEAGWGWVGGGGAASRQPWRVAYVPGRVGRAERVALVKDVASCNWELLVLPPVPATAQAEIPQERPPKLGGFGTVRIKSTDD